ncbi:hypothetical protein TeGR_g5004 [Tetraparma gracilis]|uniref:GST C-terminal domain-containing protein n=1 Tax=Tetraparma gracilis TaxID=2962635 RepID=A0ABQ6MUR4_9STRA|nr:hypothetical protein TeGR_g5004 [Tetraparma gracilis]
MHQITRAHDLYISSPNSSHPKRNLHTQACLYIPPPSPGARRGVPAALRAVLLADLFSSLSLLEALLLPGPGFCLGRAHPGPTLADFSLFPTLLYCKHYLDEVFGFDVSSPPEAPPAPDVPWLWRGLPRLHRVHAACAVGGFMERGGGELLRALDCERLNDCVRRIREDVRVNGGGLKWDNCEEPGGVGAGAS